jgi:hypothetical protein
MISRRREDKTMTTRRAIIQAGIALAAAATPALSALGTSRKAASSATGSMTYYKVVYDGQAPEAASFGASAQRLGAPVHDIDGDVTALWYHDLHPRWQRSAVPVAGMTRYCSLLGLSMMASAAGLRVIYRGNHHLEAAAPEHELFGPAAALSEPPPLSVLSRAWPAEVAGLLMRWPSEATTMERAHSSILEANRWAVGPESLVSWILAPMRRA